jgi:hypothetical protein
MQLRRLLFTLVPLAVAACSPTEPRDDQGWLRKVGLIDPAMSSMQLLLIEPQPVRAGEVRVTVSTYGDPGCVRASDTSSHVEGRIVTIVPWNLVAPDGAICGEGRARVAHELTLQLSPGAWTIRVRGRESSGRMETYAMHVDVKP